jgi:hypothetical protein
MYGEVSPSFFLNSENTRLSLDFKKDKAACKSVFIILI